ncbi:hypothetical protein [Furfurilactobacillus siliginis]|uniref:Uncharacterized protein n=1 Tax=Furfurilactobacillus siliginis TaxID=348151 RepID=A0A0R2L5E5_9LACO|nr:hypothetical protein [Furfurilactobacillus siliginis]KRN96942.1 hypothetical protein IV55_GL000817 [Furfurilactobacillus siliginis]GEK27701.1 hypothetical protein LSI01_00120 [Furfurilactobacillus siliginis]
MTEEHVLFNPGDAITNAHDYNAVYQSAQIYKQKHPHTLFIVSETDGKPYVLFDQASKRRDDPDTTKYRVIKKM